MSHKIESVDTARQTNVEIARQSTSRLKRFVSTLSDFSPSSRAGMALAAIMFVISMSPSLLPRMWWWQGVVSGIVIEVSYAVGALAGWLLNRIWRGADVRISANPKWVRAGKWLLSLSIGAWAVWMLVRSFISNNRAAKLMGFTPLSVIDYLAATAMAVLTAAVIAGLAILIVGLWRWVAKWASRLLPRWGAGIVATVILAVLSTFLISDVLFTRGMEYTYRTFAAVDQAEEAGVTRPVLPQRSGSIYSYENWDNIGKQGKRFLSKGPRAQQIEEVTGREAMEPIRIYAGLAEHRSLEESARVVAAEMQRTGALSRSALMIVTTTGTGWVEEWSVQPFEYLTGGDCAIVATQYSYVPSAIAFLREFDQPVTASKILFEAVMDEVNKLPEDERPAVYLQGVSLGAFGSESIFEDEASLLENVDGAVWAGTPNVTRLWQKLTRERNGGSPMIAPVVSSGHNIRFATKPEDLRADIYGRDLPQWQYPRVAVLQHATDPVVWWNTNIIRREPDWLKERPPSDLNPDMQWTRLATFIQVSADLPVAGLAADGHGHVYHREFIPAWAEVLGLVNNGESQRYTGANPYRGADISWFDSNVESAISTAISSDLYD